MPEELIPELIKHHEQGRFPYEKLCKKCVRASCADCNGLSALAGIRSQTSSKLSMIWSRVRHCLSLVMLAT